MSAFLTVSRQQGLYHLLTHHWIRLWTPSTRLEKGIPALENSCTPRSRWPTLCSQVDPFPPPPRYFQRCREMQALTPDTCIDHQEPLTPPHTKNSRHLKTLTLTQPQSQPQTHSFMQIALLAIREGAADLLVSFLTMTLPEIRAAAVFGLGCLVHSCPPDSDVHGVRGGAMAGGVPDHSLNMQPSEDRLPAEQLIANAVRQVGCFPGLPNMIFLRLFRSCYGFGLRESVCGTFPGM